jgi:hypothetical protein
MYLMGNVLVMGIDFKVNIYIMSIKVIFNQSNIFSSLENKYCFKDMKGNAPLL